MSTRQQSFIVTSPAAAASGVLLSTSALFLLGLPALLLRVSRA